MTPRPVNLDHFSSPSTSRSHIDILLRGSFCSKPITKCNVIDNKLSADASRILLQEIKFVDAEVPYKSVSEKLKSKYIILKSDYEVDDRGSSLLQKNLNNVTAINKSRVTNSASVSVSDGIPPPSVDLFPVEIKLKWSEPFSSIGVGFRNCGNTCFLNSILQALTYTAPLVNYLLFSHNSCNVGLNVCALCELRSHFCKALLQKGYDRSPITPGVAQKIKLFMRSYQWGRQEDAHEFLRYFIDSMQTACLNPFKNQKLDMFSKETTIISKIFGGFHRNEIFCSVCNTKSTTYDPFLDLSLEFKERELYKTVLQGGNTLESFLQHFTRPEKLQGDNAYLCGRCKRKTEARKCYTIHRPPNVLTIQLKRFGHCGKIMSQCQFPEILNLRPYMSIKQGPNEFYTLYAVVVHHGNSMNSGHYFAFVRSPKNVWHLMDDSRVTPVAVKNVLNAQAYLLFYSRNTPIAINADVADTPSLDTAVGKPGFKRPTSIDETRISPSPVRKFGTILSPSKSLSTQRVQEMSPSNGSSANGVHMMPKSAMANAYSVDHRTAINGVSTAPKKINVIGVKIQNNTVNTTTTSNGVPKPVKPVSETSSVKPIQDATITTTRLVPYDDDDTDSTGTVHCQNGDVLTPKTPKPELKNNVDTPPLRKETVDKPQTPSSNGVNSYQKTTPTTSSPALKFLPTAIIKRSISSKPSTPNNAANSTTTSSSVQVKSEEQAALTQKQTGPVESSSSKGEAKNRSLTLTNGSTGPEDRKSMTATSVYTNGSSPASGSRKSSNAGNDTAKSANSNTCNGQTSPATVLANVVSKKQNISAFGHFQQELNKNKDNRTPTASPQKAQQNNTTPVQNTHKRFYSSPEPDSPGSKVAKLERNNNNPLTVKLKKKKKKKQHADKSNSREQEVVDLQSAAPNQQVKERELEAKQPEKVDFIKKKKKNKHYRERAKEDSEEERQRRKSREKKHKELKEHKSKRSHHTSDAETPSHHHRHRDSEKYEKHASSYLKRLQQSAESSSKKSSSSRDSRDRFSSEDRSKARQQYQHRKRSSPSAEHSYHNNYGGHRSVTDSKHRKRRRSRSMSSSASTYS